MSLASALKLASSNPLALYRPRPGQEQFHRSSARHRLMRGPNQIVGKSFAGAAETAYWLLHAHPWREVPSHPLKGALIPYSDKTAKVIEGYLASFIPRRLWHRDTRYHPDVGFTTRGRRVLRLVTGDSLIVVTQSAGTLAIAGHALDFVHFDEPPGASVAAEGRARVSATRGCTWMTLTPIGRPVDWLIEEVEAGTVEDTHVQPTPENTGLEQDELDQIEQETLPAERAQRFWGRWHGVSPNRYFGAWDDSLVSRELPGEEVQLGIGIDHGEDAGREAALLVAFLRHPTDPRCWFLDEYVSEGATGIEADAMGVLDMLSRWGFRPEDVDVAVGDVNSAGKNEAGYKVNSLMTEAIARLSDLPEQRPPLRIRNARKGAGSVSYSSRLLHSAMVRGNVRVHPNCSTLIASLSSWRGPGGDAKNKSFSHIIDAARYIGREFLDTRARGAERVTLR